VLQCAAVWLQHVSVCDSVLQCVALCEYVGVFFSVLQHVAIRVFSV